MQRTVMQLAGGWGRPSASSGFTLVELLLVLVVISVLVAIAVPSYLGMQARAADRTARHNLRAAHPAAEAFALANVGVKGDADNKAATRGYKGMTAALLRAKYDAGISKTLKVVSGKTSETQYCLADTVDGRAWSTLGNGSYSNNAKCK